jgi:hypothetical protein
MGNRGPHGSESEMKMKMTSFDMNDSSRASVAPSPHHERTQIPRCGGMKPSKKKLSVRLALVEMETIHKTEKEESGQILFHWTQYNLTEYCYSKSQ